MNTLEMMMACKGTNDVYKCGVFEYSGKSLFKAPFTIGTASIEASVNSFLLMTGWIKVPQFSDIEITILKAIDTKYKWLARDEWHSGLYVYQEKPKRDGEMWIEDEHEHISLELFNHLFQSITWESEPMEIVQVIK